MNEEQVVDDRAVLRIRPLRMKRITSWAMECLTCEEDSAVKNKSTAQRLAVAHARAKHRGHAVIKETGLRR